MTHTSATLTALESSWHAVTARHPEIPPVAIVLGAGSDRRKGLWKWGHFAALRWRDEERQVSEVLIAGEGLRRPAEEVMGTLLHEAAHALAHVRELQDVSRGGRYHNEKFAAVARELALDVEKVAPWGWAATTMSAAALDAYKPQLLELATALSAYRLPESAAGKKAKSTNLQPAECPCGRRLRVAASTLEAAPIICGACGGAFAVVA